ncbi:MAG: ubiquinol-cytochrome c reductase iron-sulfur subunit [Deltaproteobacteria bacterium]
MSCEHCLNRRDFFAKSALAAAALLAAQACGDGQIGPPAPQSVAGDPLLPLGGPVTIKLSDYPALANTGVIVEIPKERTVMRTGPSTFLALSRLCSHQQCDIDIKGDHFECPCHGSQFTATGQVIRGPNIASPPIGPLRSLNVTVDQAGGTLTIE